MESDKMESESATRSLESIETSDFGVLLRSYRCRSPPIWLDFDSDVSDDEDFNKLLKNLMAVRRAQSSGFCVFFWDYTYRSPPRRVEFSLSEKKRIVSAVDDWISSLDDPMAVRRAQLVMQRWVDFGSDVSAVEDFNKLLDDLMAVRRAQRYMQRRGDCSLSEKKRIVSAVDNWINSLDDQMAEEMAQLYMEIWGFFGSDVSAVEDFNKLLDDLMAMGRPESPDSDVSLKSDQSKAGLIDFKDRVSVMSDFSSTEEDDVSDGKDLVESPDDLEEMNQELSSEVGWKHG